MFDLSLSFGISRTGTSVSVNALLTENSVALATENNVYLTIEG